MNIRNVRKQLSDYRKQGKPLKYLINYIMSLDFSEQEIIREMKALSFNEDEIVRYLEYDFAIDMSWHPMSVNHKKKREGIVMNEREKEILKDNLNAFVTNFGEVRIEKEDFGAGYYVFSPSTSESYVQYCYNIDYLNGWLYGCVQGALNCVKIKEERKKELEGCLCTEVKK